MDEEFLDDKLSDDARQESGNTENEQKYEISSDLIRGHINTIILRTLYERDKYGYEIINEIEQKSHGQYSLKQPTLYSALKRLESQGYIKAYWKTDEVTSGGRRKYFTLTDSGKEITEKNLSEWEYSRTIIDNLISDRSFDFSQPAPTHVDFNILKKSVSKVPTVKADEGLEKYSPENTSPACPQSYYVGEVTYNSLNTQTDKNGIDKPDGQTKDDFATNRGSQSTNQEQAKEFEERRLAHENFLKLISAPAPSKEDKDEEPAATEDGMDPNAIIYATKPETEKNYKDLVNAIYAKTVKQSHAQPQHVAQTRYAVSNQQLDSILKKGQSDGLKINLSTQANTRGVGADDTTYNVGTTLFKSSLIVGFIVLIEFIFCTIFKSELGVGIIYPLVILLLGVAQLSVFGLLSLTGFKKDNPKPTTHGYVSASIIVTIIIILIICFIAFLTNVNIAMPSDIMVKIVVPSVVAINIPIFCIAYCLFSK